MKMDLQDKLTDCLKSYMYKIAGINQMVVTDKKSGEILGAFSKFTNSNGVSDIAGFSHTLVQLSQASKKDIDVNTFEFNTGEKLFTVSGGENLVISAVSDDKSQIGISRMYLKKFARGLDKSYPRLKNSLMRQNQETELAEIFNQLSS
jgi:predicted regulator of Ras-like GTPase activity (Roadblock/LC7/MglB family)